MNWTQMLPVTLLLATGARGEGLPALLQRIAGAYGGEKKLLAVRSVRETGTVTSERGGGTVVRAFEPPLRLSVEIHRSAAGSSEVRVLDGSRGARDGQAVFGPPLDAMVLQAVRLDLPAALLRHRDRLRDLGEIERAGKKLRSIGLPLEGGKAIAVGVEVGTARIVYSEGAVGTIRFATVYSDFRRVDGLLFAFQEENFAEGVKTADTHLARIEVNQALPPDTFQLGR